MILNISLIGAVLAAVITLATLRRGARLLVNLLGEENCLPPETASGCVWWLWSVLFSLGIVAWLAVTLGPWALLAAPVGPALSLVWFALTLRFGERRARKREFRFEDGHPVGKDGAPLRPTYVLDDCDFSPAGPGRGYALYSIALSRDRDVLATNGYVAQSVYLRHSRRLLYDLGLLGWDAVVEWRPSQNECRFVCMGAIWTTLMCAELDSVPARSRTFWESVRQPALGELGCLEVLGADLEIHLEDLASCIADQTHAAYLREDVGAIRRLISQAGDASLRVLTTARHTQDVEHLYADKTGSLRDEDGLNILAGPR
jgi:hypothetical protein